MATAPAPEHPPTPSSFDCSSTEGDIEADSSSSIESSTENSSLSEAGDEAAAAAAAGGKHALAGEIEAAVRKARERGHEVSVLRGGSVVLLPRATSSTPLKRDARALWHHNREATADCVLVLHPRGARVFACSEYLMAGSDMFKAMLSNSSFAEASTRRLDLHLPCPAQADMALCFMYSAELSSEAIQLDATGLFGLLENAHYLQSHELTAATLAVLRARLRHGGPAGESFFTAVVTHPAFGPEFVPLEWLVGFVRCTPERSTHDRVRAALAWTRAADLADPFTREALTPLAEALDARIATASAAEAAALVREFGGPLRALVAMDATLLPVLERAAAYASAMRGHQRQLWTELNRARRALASMEALTAYRRCERCHANVPQYLSEDESCTASLHPGRYYNFSEETRRGGWTCCGATSKTAKGCRGRSCRHRFTEGTEVFAGLSSAVAGEEGVEGRGLFARDDEGEDEARLEALQMLLQRAERPQVWQQQG